MPVDQVIGDRLIYVERLKRGVPELVLAAEMPDSRHQSLADPCRLLVLAKAGKASLRRAHGLDRGPEKPFAL